MLSVSMSAYPWDLADAEAGDLLDRLQGEVGINGLTISATEPAVIALRSQPMSPRVFRTRGGVFFHPSTTRYANTRCKPIASSWIKSRDPFTKIASACNDRGLSLRAVVSATKTGRLALRYPELACKNVFGDVSHESLCLSNGDVQAFLCDVVADLSAAHSLSAILLKDVGCQWSEAFRSDLKATTSLGLCARKLLGLCFCESCHQQAAKANLALSQLQDFVAGLLNRVIQQGTPNDAEVTSIMADNELLEPHSQWLRNSVKEALASARESCRCELGLYVGDNSNQEIAIAQSANLDLIVSNYDSDDRSQDSFSNITSEQPEIRSETKLNLNAFGLGSSDFVNTFQSAAEQGVAGLEVGPLGQCCDATFSTLKQAIRFARRSLAS